MMKSKKDLKEVIGENIAFLRKREKMTQSELSEKLNYSDKAISKWERGESTPDPDSLLQLSELFNVQIDYFFHEENKEQYVNKNNYLKVRGLLITILMCVSVYFVAISVFLIAWLRDHTNVATFWVAFIYPLPICCFFLFRYYRKLNNLPLKIIFASLALWTILATAYLQLLVLGFNPWMIFIIGAPIQAAIIILHFVNK